MKNMCIVTVLIALFVICVRNCSSEDAMDEVNYIWKAEHWQGMTWFDMVNTHFKWKVKDELWTLYNRWALTKLKVIPLLMECGYGKKLIDFLRIASYAVTECRDLSKYDLGYAQDCWLKLQDSLNRGSLTIFIMLCTYVHVNQLDLRLDVDANQFYDTLLEIHDFFMQPRSCVKKGLAATEAEILCEDIKSFATFLGTLWNNTCQPAHSIVSQEELQNEYEHQPRIGDQVAIPNLYDFYVNTLHSSTDFILEHMHDIGFRYSPNTKKVTFTLPTGSSVTRR